MGIFKDAAHRLLRTKWGSDADLLAEELYALFRQEELQIDGPVTITNETTDPAITIQLGNEDASNDIATVDSAGEDVPDATGGGGTFAKILSGSGDTYQVGLYENGPDAAQTQAVEATCVQILATETIPVDTWVVVITIPAFTVGVIFNPAQYFFSVPIWL